MRRGWISLGLAVAVWATAQVALAQEPWSLEALDYPTKPEDFPRGPGFYYSIPKLAILWLLFLAWVAVGDWVSRDAIKLKLNVRRWNPIVLGTFVGAILLGWLTNSFWLALIAQLAALVVPLTLYIKQRNVVADIDDRVMTREHLRGMAARLLAPLGVKIEVEKKSRDASPVEFIARGAADDRQDQINLFNAKRSAGYAPAGKLLDDAIQRRATAIMLEYSAEMTVIRYQIDGVWRDVPTVDREVGDAILVVLKTVSGLDPAQRVAPQQGTFDVRRNKQNVAFRISSRGTSTAERVVMNIDEGTPHKARLATIGLTGKPLEALQQAVERRNGLIVASAPVNGGMTTLITAVTAAVDRYMRSVSALEEKKQLDLKVENVTVVAYDAATEKPVDALNLMMRQYPDAVVVPNIPDAATLDQLCQIAGEDRLAIISLPASDAVGALLRAGSLKGSWKSFVRTVTASVNMRLVRKLCEHCKEAYPPPPDLLQKLGLAGKIESFYRPPEPPPPDDKKAKKFEPCKHCGGDGFHGRTGMFEVLILDDNVRNVLLTDPKPESVRQAARKAGMKSLQDEGIRLVAEGVTSLPEVMRVLKQKD